MHVTRAEQFIPLGERGRDVPVRVPDQRNLTINAHGLSMVELLKETRQIRLPVPSQKSTNCKSWLCGQDQLEAPTKGGILVALSSTKINQKVLFTVERPQTSLERESLLEVADGSVPSFPSIHLAAFI